MAPDEPEATPTATTPPQDAAQPAQAVDPAAGAAAVVGTAQPAEAPAKRSFWAWLSQGYTAHFRTPLKAVLIAFLTAVAVVWALDRVGTINFASFCPDRMSACHTKGKIFIDSPEVYTRERLVNDRFLQDSWLRAQLHKLDEEEVAIQSIITSQFQMGQEVAGQEEASVTLEKLSKLRPHFALAFEQKVAQREAIRQRIIENQLDDRHDFDGNTLFMLKFDTSILPKSNAAAAVIEVELHPDTPALPLQRFPDHIPSYVDIPLGTGWQQNPQWRLYQNWMSNESDRLNDTTRRLFVDFAQGNLEDDLSKDFYFYLQSIDYIAPLHPKLAGYLDAAERAALTLDGVSAVNVAPQTAATGGATPIAVAAETVRIVAEPNAIIDELAKHWIADETVWKIMRPYVNLFVAARTLRETFDNAEVYSLYFTDLERQICVERRQPGCSFFPPRLRDAPPSDAELLAVLQKEANFYVSKPSGFEGFNLGLSWSANTKDPPQWSALPTTETYAIAKGAGCVGALQAAFFAEPSVAAGEVEYRMQQQFGTKSGGVALPLKKLSRMHRLKDGQQDYVDKSFQPEASWANQLPKLYDYIDASDALKSRFFLSILLPSLEMQRAEASKRVTEQRASGEQPMDLAMVPQTPVEQACEPKQKVVQTLEGSGAPAKLEFLTIQSGFYNFAARTADKTAFSYAALPRSDSNIVQTDSGTGVNANLPFGAGGSAAFKERAAGVRGQQALIGYGSESRVQMNDRRALLEARLVKSGYNMAEIEEGLLDIKATHLEHVTVPKVGWAIFPGAQNRSAAGRTRFEPVQRSVSALFSVPAWGGDIKLGVNLGWLDSSGSIQYIDNTGALQAPAFQEGGKTPRRIITRSAISGHVENCDYTHCFIIPFPTNITSVADIQRRWLPREPKISNMDSNPKIKVRSCRSASIEISGQRLWRNTTVTLGGQTADRIEVLPNMRGVVATFDPVRPFHRTPIQASANVGKKKSEKGEWVDLVVWTSEGKAVYPYRISVLSPFVTDMEQNRCIGDPQ